MEMLLSFRNSSIRVIQSQFSKIVLSLLLVFSVSTGFVHADVGSMILFFPTSEHISKQWKISELQAQNGVDIEDSKETANVIARAFSIQDTEDPKSKITESLTMFEFNSPQIANQMQSRIIEKFFAPQENSSVIKIDGFENCFGSVINPKMVNEKSSVSCVEDSFVIISQSTQSGFVYEQGKKLETSRISSAFATFVLDQLSQEPAIPQWIKNNAKWWADGTIDDASFLSAIEFLIKNGIISVR